MDKLWSFQLGCLVDIFKKPDEVSLSSEGKHLTEFVANDKIQAVKQQLEFWKTFSCHPELDSFSILNDFSELGGDINECNFFGIL